MTKISENEWRAELERVYQAQDADGMSTKELAKALSVGPVTARGYLHELIDAGEWEYAGKANRPSVDGRRCRVSVYRPIRRVAGDEVGAEPAADAAESA